MFTNLENVHPLDVCDFLCLDRDGDVLSLKRQLLAFHTLLQAKQSESKVKHTEIELIVLCTHTDILCSHAIYTDYDIKLYNLVFLLTADM